MKNRLLLLCLFGVFTANGSQKSKSLERIIIAVDGALSLRYLGIVHCYDTSTQREEIENILYKGQDKKKRVDYFMDDKERSRVQSDDTGLTYTTDLKKISTTQHIIEDKVADGLKKGIVVYTTKNSVSNEQHIAHVGALLEGDLKVCVLTQDNELATKMKKHFSEKGINTSSVIIYSQKSNFYLSIGLLACCLCAGLWMYRFITQKYA